MIVMHIAHEFAVRDRHGKRLSPNDLHESGEELMSALLDLEKCNEDMKDSTTSSEADRGILLAELVVTARDESDALAKSLTLVRTAIHAIGGATPGWENPAEPNTEFEPTGYELVYV